MQLPTRCSYCWGTSLVRGRRWLLHTRMPHDLHTITQVCQHVHSMSTCTHYNTVCQHVHTVCQHVQLRGCTYTLSILSPLINLIFFINAISNYCTSDMVTICTCWVAIIRNDLHNGLAGIDTATVFTLFSILDPLFSVDLYHIGQ